MRFSLSPHSSSVAAQRLVNSSHVSTALRLRSTASTEHRPEDTGTSLSAAPEAKVGYAAETGATWSEPLVDGARVCSKRRVGTRQNTTQAQAMATQRAAYRGAAGSYTAKKRMSE